MASDTHYKAEQLIAFAEKVLNFIGLEEEKSAVVASTLVEADLLGHSTHGLQLLPAYVQELLDGNMTKSGEPTLINDSGAAITWNGDYLPGPWLVQKAIDLALERILNHPVVTIVIQQSHHIACLAAYLEQVTQHGYLVLLSCSDPKNKTVAPFGGTVGVYSPNPLAAGIPTEGDPILMDVSMSATANAYVKRAHDEEKDLPHAWLLNTDKQVTNNASEFFKEPPATILPLGGMDSGHKGFALGILVEALTSALAGFGRADEPRRWTASVFLQVINPDAFGGGDKFRRENQYLADICRQWEDVRLPGERGLALKREQLKNGLLLYPTVIQGLKALEKQFGISIHQE